VSSDPFTDRRALTATAYADPTRLVTRYSLYRYRQPALNLMAVAAELLHDVPGPVLDVGCGPGRFVAALREDRPHRTVLAVDLSPGMIAAAGPPGVVADICALPVADRSCGGLLAMHMLYHVPDPDAGIRELARARAPGGTVLISTNDDEDKAALYTVCRAATADVPHAGVWRREGWRRFALRAAEDTARRHFARVQRMDFTGEIVVPDPEPVVAFVGSLGPWTRPAMFDRVLDRIRDRVAGIIARDGAFRIRTRIGVLVCR
jgi:SAM-dependent methyltransferase